MVVSLVCLLRDVDTFFLLTLLGSRRPSLASVHSSASSAKSFSAKRLERERNEKEQRQALQELKLSRQREKESQEQVAPTPSPRTPHSTDELLPSVEEGKEATYNQVQKTDKILKIKKMLMLKIVIMICGNDIGRYLQCLVLKIQL